MWESFSEKKGRLWGIWSSLALGDFQLCVYLTLLTSLTLQIYLGQAFTDISVCVYMRNVHPRERHAKRNWQDDRLSEAEWGDRAPHILLAPQASKSLNLFFFLIHQLGGHCPAKTLSPVKVLQQTQGENAQRWDQRTHNSPTSEVRVRSVLLEDIQPWQGLT